VIQSKHSLIEVIGLLVCAALLLAGCGNGSIGTAASGSKVQQTSAIGRESKTMTASSVRRIFSRPMREPLAPGAD
jgi:F0F1-type ATP synthase membrane subunit c/vacuolar-type H+-ATPase subunit K